MKELWFGHGRVVLPDEILEDSSVLVRDGKIAAVGKECPASAERIDAHGDYILPGFIDIHLHGGGGADFMDMDPDAFRQAMYAHCAHGTTALVPTSMTCPDGQLLEMIDVFLDVLSHPMTGPELLGLHLEGPYFSAASKGAQPVTEQRIPKEEDLERIIAHAQGHILRWDAAPELDGMEVFARVMKKHGILASVAHTAANATTAMWAFDLGFSHMTHFYNAMTTFHKENRIVHAGTIEAAYLRDDVTIELIGDGRHIPKESMQLAYRIKGPDRIALITDAMRAAGTDVKESVLGPLEGGVPCVILDDVAQLTDLSSYAGSISTMDRDLRVAHRDYGLPLPHVSRMLSLTPARLCGCADRLGSIAEGKDADLVLMGPELQVEQVYVKGRRFEG